MKMSKREKSGEKTFKAGIEWNRLGLIGEKKTKKIKDKNFF